MPSYYAVAGYSLRDLREALADVVVVKNVSGANFANCLSAEVSEMKAGWVVVRNGAAARRCVEWYEGWQKPNEHVGDARVCEIELESESEHECDYVSILVDRLMTLKQVAGQAWVEGVEGVGTSKDEAVVETYRGMGAGALHAGWVAEARVRENDNPHKQAMGDFRVNTFF